MKPLNRGELRRPHKDRTHPDYKQSMMLGTGEIRVRPVRDRVGPLEIRAKMADGTFMDVRGFTSPEQAASRAGLRLVGPAHREERKKLRLEARSKAFRAMAEEGGW